MKDKINIYNLFWIFVLASVVGWVVEGIFTYVTANYLMNHSAVVLGPFDFAYGISALTLTTILYKFRNDNYFKIFIIGFIGGTIVEYLMSWGMELILGFSAWNYSDEFLSINGRVCLKYSIFWGVLSIGWIKFLYPKLIKLINKFDYKKGKIIAIILSIFLIFDIFLTIVAVERAKDKKHGIEPSNKIEEFLDNTFNSDYLRKMYGRGWKNYQ